jgi:AbiU2
MAAFVDELELFRTEEEVAQQYFFGYLSLQSVPGSNPAVLSRLNDTPMFWITTRHALLLAAFVALGRIFDQDARSIHNINKLMRSVSDNIALFTRAGLDQRKIADGLAATVAAEYVKGKYDLTTDDVRGMRKAVAHWRGIYEARYRDIRHGAFAHKGLSRADTDLLMAKTNIEEMKSMFGFLHSLHLSLWELYFNGRKPDLTPATFVMPPLARHAGASLKAGELVYRDSLDVLYGMLSPSEADRSDD